MVGPLIARPSKVEEALVQRRKAQVEIRHQPLRGAFLIGDFRGQAVERGTRFGQPFAKQFGSFDPGAANTAPSS